MASAVDDEDLALSINPAYTSRRGSSRGNDSYNQPPQRQHAHSDRERFPAAQMQKTTHRLGQYQVIKTLGEGSFGKVKLAVHQITGQKVALKVISRKKLVARDMAGRVEREIQYLQLLRHPHIIKLYTVITTPSEIIMVLEYAGSELFNYIVENGKMEETRARAFFQQIVCAVEYCHRHKIVHRDLKPENLLLDEFLHVKIADFGLSNIMTDGNFLKTSCGSPNYAAPEVISGKLYAGPEVDVWSCGVILYVLLVGRLPFDDEYIPALFKKIAQGVYHVPHYLSSGAARLIKKMLQISPVNRITVQEIRQDPWFVKDIPEYLKPPVEEFIDTGVDPNKAIDPRSLAPNEPAAVQEKIHNKVIEKLGRTMGYATEDIHQSLNINEPNAIKDAYLIVRENQMMKDNPSLTNDPALQPFLATSPPPSTHHPSISQLTESPRKGPISSPNKAIPNRAKPIPNSSATGISAQEPRSLVTTIGVLPSSMPDYHQAFMVGQPKSPLQDQAGHDSARDLKPHSKSQLNLDKIKKPEGMTPVHNTHKKLRPTKWQFGIRSRNAPAEAMLAIFKALKAMGAEWEIPEPRKAGGGSGVTSAPDTDASDNSSSDFGDSGDFSDSLNHDGSGDAVNKRGSVDSTASSQRGRRRSRSFERYGDWNDWGYSVPSDPWIINARFRKDDMFPPGVAHPNSTHSSNVDLATSTTNEGSGVSSSRGSDTALVPRRRSSTLSSASAAAGESLSQTSSIAQSGNTPLSRSSSGRVPNKPDESVWVYMTIQLYSIEKEFYLVDFKCAGYERLVKRIVRNIATRTSEIAERPSSPDGDGNTGDTESKSSKRSVSASQLREEWVGDGRAAEEKDASSPFPFLDVASRLIIQLAEAE